ncbi:hypothetical protein [Leptospira noguchii]|nr:hypothetical protein [Leptospira noguchii]
MKNSKGIGAKTNNLSVSLLWSLGKLSGRLPMVGIQGVRCT